MSVDAGFLPPSADLLGVGFNRQRINSAMKTATHGSLYIEAPANPQPQHSTTSLLLLLLQTTTQRKQRLNSLLSLSPSPTKFGEKSSTV